VSPENPQSGLNKFFHMDRMFNVWPASRRWMTGQTLVGVMLLALFSPARAADFEHVIMALTLNTEKTGDDFFLVGNHGEVLITRDQLSALGVTPLDRWPLLYIDGRSYYALTSLAPEITFTLDMSRGEISLTAQPALFQKQQVELLTYRRNVDVVRSEDLSLIFNYRLSAGYSNNVQFENMRAPLQLSLGQGSVYGVTAWTYSMDRDKSREWSRQGTSLLYDRPANLQRAVFGDFNAANGLLGGSGSFGGVSFGRAFGMDPYFKKYSLPQFQGVLDVPAQVDLYLNDTKIKSQSLRPGEFVLGYIPITGGYGEMKVVTRDAFGSEIETLQTYYVSMSLLTPGLHDYSYNLGFLRMDPSEDLFSYEDLSFLGYHRLGLTRWFTGGVRGEAGHDLYNLALTAQLLLGNYGEIDLVAAASSAQGHEGGAIGMAYQFIHRKFNLRTFAKQQGRLYSNLSLEPEDDRVRTELNLNFGLPLGWIGSLSFGYNYKDYERSADIRTQRIYYSKRLTNAFSLNVSASRQETSDHGNTDNRVKHEVFVGLTWLFAKDELARYDYRKQVDRREDTLTIQKNPPVGNGLSYNVRAGQRDNDNEERQLDSRFSFRAPYGIYEAWCSRYKDEDRYSLSTAGAVSVVDSKVYVTKPVNDSLVVVKVSEIPDVAVNLNNQEFGRTDRRGTVAVTDVYAYRDNLISISDRDIPINYRLTKVQQYVSPYSRSGGVVDFAATKLQGLTGSVFVGVAEESKPAQYALLTLEVAGHTQEYVVGKGGEFYLENVPPGQYRANVLFEEKLCHFTMEIQQSDDILVDLGTYACVYP